MDCRLENPARKSRIIRGPAAPATWACSAQRWPVHGARAGWKRTGGTVPATGYGNEGIGQEKALIKQDRAAGWTTACLSCDKARSFRAHGSHQTGPRCRLDHGLFAVRQRAIISRSRLSGKNREGTTMAKHETTTPPRIRNIRTAVAVLLGALVIALVLYGTVYTTGLTEGEFTEGEHYVLLKDPVRTDAGGTLEVIEFFSYGCVHCFNFDPQIEDWKADLPEGVRFRRQPVSFSPSWALLGQAYYALEDIGILDRNHTRIFRAIHEQGRQFLSVEELADFIDGRGASREEFTRAFNSSAVRRFAGQMERMQLRYEVQAVPTIVVAGKYVIKSDVPRKIALDVVDHLIEKEQKGSTPQ
jgi:thiol:disulfide interchange protein DsbA